MPSLKHLVCNIEWIGTNTPLREYCTIYEDGKAATYVAIPEVPTPFAVRLRSQGWIAFGLAMFVYIDGEYQCNRNRRNLKIPNGKYSRRHTEVEFIVQQKETALPDGSFVGRPWRFECPNPSTLQDQQSSGISKPQYTGTIEIVVLRCYPSGESSLENSSGQRQGKSQGKGLSGGRKNAKQKQKENKHSAQENPAFGGGDGALGDPYKPHIHDGTRNWAIEMADLGSGVYLPIDTIASNQAFASSTASKTEGLEYQLPAQSLEGHRYQSEAQLRYSLKVPKKMDRKSSRLSQKDARGSKLADNPSGVSNQEDFSDKLNYKSNHVPTKLDGEDTGAAARRKIPGAWTEDWTSDDENPNNDGDVTKANGGWWASNNLDADSDSWADPVEFTNVNGAELTPRTDEHVADDPPEGTRSAEPTPKVDNCAIEKRTLHSFGQHHTESLPTDFVDWNRDTQSDPSNRLDVGNVPNAAATDHPKPNATPVGFASQDSPARLAATPEQKEDRGSNSSFAHIPFQPMVDVGAIPQNAVQREMSVFPRIMRKNISDMSLDRQEPLPTRAFKKQHDWTHPGDGTATNSSHACGKGDLSSTVSKDKTQCENMYHQIQSGNPTSYVHKTASPTYMDTVDAPYALFTFHYRSIALLEKELNITVVEVEAEEKERLQNLSKDEIIGHYLRAKAVAQKQNSDAGASVADQGGLSGSSRKSESVVGSVKLSSDKAYGLEAANEDPAPLAEYDVANPNSSSFEPPKKVSNRARSQSNSRSQKGRGKRKPRTHNIPQPVGGGNNGFEWDNSGAQNTTRDPHDGGYWNQAATGNDSWNQTGTANENWNGGGQHGEDQANGEWNSGEEPNVQTAQVWESNEVGAADTAW